jgi:L-fucose mutarotase
VLKGLHPLLAPDLLHALASMGHGDTIAIVDGNFPATANARRLIDVPGISSPAMFAAILTVLPLDARVSPALFTMEVTGDPTAVPPPVTEFATVLTEQGMADMEIGHLERHAFYERSRAAFAIVRTGEQRRFGNILLVKGVIASD